MPRVDPRTPKLASNVRDQTAQIPPYDPLPLCGSRKTTSPSPLGIPPVSSLEETRPSSSDHTEKSENPHRAKQIQHGRRERGRMRRNGSGTEPVLRLEWSGQSGVAEFRHYISLFIADIVIIILLEKS